MKVTLDLSKLRETGKITVEEYERLQSLAAESTGSLAFNILVGFGVIAVAGGALALFPHPANAILLGAVIALFGLLLGFRFRQQWGVLGNISVLIGALLLGGGIIGWGEGSLTCISLTAGLFFLGAIAARSGLLMTLAVLVSSACVGSMTDYTHAAYYFGVQKPLLAIVVYTLVAIGAYAVSLRVSADYQRLAIIASRASVLIVNMGFWIGSLWGDRLGGARSWADGQVTGVGIPAATFSAGWALALMAAAAWGVSRNRRWLVNTVAVFGAIHFYTQWFEHLGADPFSVLLAGILAIAIAVGIRSFNRKMMERVRPAERSA